MIEGFADDDVNRLIDVDTMKEVAFSLVSIGWSANPAPTSNARLEPLALAVMPYSKEEVDYPAMRLIHQSSSLAEEEISLGNGQRARFRSQPTRRARLIR